MHLFLIENANELNLLGVAILLFVFSIYPIIVSLFNT